MYQEVSRRQKLSPLTIFIGISVCFGFLYFINTVAYILDFRSSWIDLITFTIAGVIIYIMIREYFMSYRYMLIENEFIIHQIVGSKEKSLLTIHIRQLKKIGLLHKKPTSKAQRFCHMWLQKETLYYGCYVEEGEDHIFIFQPTEKLVQLLQDKVEVISCKKNC